MEQEASNFVAGIANVALSSATGKHPMNDPEPDEKADGAHEKVPDPSAMAVGVADARLSASGHKTSAHHDKTKIPMETAIWNKMRPIMHVIGDIADTWERFANALSPTPPFPEDQARLRMAGLVIPLLAVSLFVSAYMFMKGVTFGIGFGFFGDPVIQRGIVWLNREFPHWQRLLELRNTILKGVPTNAQLTITLLRTGEANKAPLPPPPSTSQAPPMENAHISGDDLNSAGNDAPLGASLSEIQAATTPDPNVAHQTAGKDVDMSKNAKHGKKGAKLLHFFRSTAKYTLETALGADRLKATVGSTPAKQRLGVLKRPHQELISGPVDFRARYDGKKGHVYISAKATIPCVAFTTDHTVERVGTQDRDDLHPAWSVAIADIKELKKIGGFGWKAKLVIGWATERRKSCSAARLGTSLARESVLMLMCRDCRRAGDCGPVGQHVEDYRVSAPRRALQPAGRHGRAEVGDVVRYTISAVYGSRRCCSGISLEYFGRWLDKSRTGAAWGVYEIRMWRAPVVSLMSYESGTVLLACVLRHGACYNSLSIPQGHSLADPNLMGCGLRTAGGLHTDNTTNTAPSQGRTTRI